MRVTGTSVGRPGRPGAPDRRGRQSAAGRSLAERLDPVPQGVRHVVLAAVRHQLAQLRLEPEGADTWPAQIEVAGDLDAALLGQLAVEVVVQPFDRLVAAEEAGGRLGGANYSSATLTEIDGVSNLPTSTSWTTGTNPCAIAVVPYTKTAPYTNYIYVANSNTSNVTQLYEEYASIPNLVPLTTAITALTGNTTTSANPTFSFTTSTTTTPPTGI